MTAQVRSGESTRYTVRLGLRPGDRSVEFRVVTAMGELKAVVMAACRMAHVSPEESTLTVEIVHVEHEFSIDPEHDLLDYWEMS